MRSIIWPGWKSKQPFQEIGRRLQYISKKKTIGMFAKVDRCMIGQGAASFVDPHTVEVADEQITGRKIFICAGTRPEIPKFPGIESIDMLTNENLFHLDGVPDSLIVVGGGSTACEMAQAFARLGSKVTIIIRGPRIMWREDIESTDIIERSFEADGITILREQNPTGFSKKGDRVIMTTDRGEMIEAARVLVAAGRRMDFDAMRLDRAGVRHTVRGITVNKRLQTSCRHIYACGDCNGYHQYSHAAMHQGMIALMNSMMPPLMKFDFRKYVVPWTMFTDPQISRAGMSLRELEAAGTKKYETITINYEDYGAAIAESVDVGHIKALVSPTLGRIYGVTIVGEGSGEMINEWALAIQNRLTMRHILFQQHSFPTMGFLTKRAGETWTMNRMQSGFLKKMCRFMFRM